MDQAPAAIVGIALKREKRRKHISDRLVALAAEAGVELRFVDKEVPLEQQGPFHAILQKVRKPGEAAAAAPLPPPVPVSTLVASLHPNRTQPKPSTSQPTEWERQLEAYAAAHPETRVFDLPAATYPLRNRGTMVSFLDGGGWVFEARWRGSEGGGSAL